MRLYTIFVRETFRIMFAGKIEQFLLQKNCTHCLQYTSNKVSSVLIVSNVLIVSTPLSVQTIRLTHHNPNPPRISNTSLFKFSPLSYLFVSKVNAIIPLTSPSQPYSQNSKELLPKTPSQDLIDIVGLTKHLGNTLPTI